MITDYSCPFCGEPWPETETILSNGQLGCPCQAGAATPLSAQQKAALHRLAVMHRRHGIDPDHTCGDCALLTALGRNRTYYKCARYGITAGSGTDWRKKWTACGQWQARTPDHAANQD